MRGQVLGVDRRTGEGQVAGEDGLRYAFAPTDWATVGEPAVGLLVDFEPDRDRALALFPVPGSVPVPLPVSGPASGPGPLARGAPPVPGTDRDKLVAALLAFFLGIFGAHRFYLGRNGSGVVMLLLTLSAVGTLFSLPWSIVDAVRLLFMTNRDFARRYERVS